MRKRYNTPHRSRVVKTRMTEEEYAEFAERLSAYNMSQAEFIRQAITGAAIRPIITVSPVNDELLAAVGKLTAEYGRIGGNLNQIARTLNEWHSPYPQLAGEVRAAVSDLAAPDMAIMDITDIEPLLMAVYELLEESGIFVFATQHPCFITLTEKYMTPHSYYGIAIEGQPEEQIYYHRSIQDIFNLCFRAGFVIDGFYEECFKNNKEIPMVMIVRLKKVKRDSLK